VAKLILPYAVQIVQAAPAVSEGGDPVRTARRGGSAPLHESHPPASTSRAAATAPAPTTARASTQTVDPPVRTVQLELKDSLTLKDLVEVIAAELHLNLVFDESALNVPIAVRLSGPLPEDALLPLLRSVLQGKGFTL